MLDGCHQFGERVLFHLLCEFGERWQRGERWGEMGRDGERWGEMGRDGERWGEMGKREMGRGRDVGGVE